MRVTQSVRYREVITDLRRRGQALLAGADDLERMVALERHPVSPPARGWKKGRAKTGGSDDVILGVICDGADTMKTITAQAKVKPYVAVCAVKRLMAAKKVTAVGHTSTRRYRLTRAIGLRARRK